MDENIEPFVVQHQPGHDGLEFFHLEDDVKLRDRMRASWFVAQGARFHAKSIRHRVPQTFSDLSRIGVIVDMGMVAPDFSHFGPSWSCSWDVRFVPRWWRRDR